MPSMYSSTSTPRFSRIILGLALYAAAFLSTLQSPGAFSQSGKKPAAAPARSAAKVQSRSVRPSLDALVTRAQSYWNYLAKGKKLQAMEYVEPSCREYFSERPFPSFTTPRIVKLEPSERGDRVALTVTVKRLLPVLGEVDYPVTNQWQFTKSNWWLIMKDDRSPAAIGMLESKGKPINPEEIEKQKSYIRSHLEFTNNSIDFGTVRKGQWAEFGIEYQWTGDQPVDAKFLPAPRELYGFPDRKLLPGPDRRIVMRMPTASYDGKFQESFKIQVTFAHASLAFEFTLLGRVYTPVSVLPSVVRFHAGETEKDVELINNSPAEVRLDSYDSESKGYEVSPLPQTLGPGAHCVLKMKLLLKYPERNQAEEVYIKLAEPVQEMATVHVPVVANAVDVPKQKSPMDLTEQEIQELIRKSGQKPINP